MLAVRDLSRLTLPALLACGLLQGCLLGPISEPPWHPGADGGGDASVVGDSSPPGVDAGGDSDPTAGTADDLSGGLEGRSESLPLPLPAGPCCDHPLYWFRDAGDGRSDAGITPWRE